MHVLQTDVLGMADGEAPCWLNAVCGWFVIAACSFVATDGCLAVATEKEWVAATLFFNIFHGQSTTELDVEILDADMANGILLHACNQTGIAAIGIGDMDVADADVADLRGMESFGCPHSVSEANVDGRVANVGHRQVVDADVFHLCSVNGFEGESTAMGEATLADGDVSEATIRLCA